MGEGQKLTPDEQIRSAFEAYESGRDFTVAVEEEFAILDPDTLELDNRFEELQAAGRGTPLEEHLVGELIASEVAVRTGRCESFAEAAAKMVERRAQLHELARSIGVALACTGTHPWSRWQDQRIIDTPHYRRNDDPPLRRVAQQHVRPPRARWHPWRRSGRRGLQSPAQLPARAARAVGELAVRRGSRQRFALRADGDLHADVPALRRAGRIRGLGRLRTLRPLPLRHRLDRRAHADLVERPPAPCLSDRGDPNLRCRSGRRRRAVARRADLHAD